MISVAIMAHPRRGDFVAQLKQTLPMAEVVWDCSNDEWETGRRTLLAHDPTASHHLLIQDDAIVPANLVSAVGQAVTFAGNHPIGLYQGAANTGPTAWRRARAIEEAKKVGSPWISCGGPWWGVGFVVATELIQPLVEWCDRNREFAAFDRRIARYFELDSLDCWYTVPSLVDHRPAKENPSLYSDRHQSRQAFEYVGRSPLGIDWSRPPVAVLTAEEQRAKRIRLHHQRRRTVAVKPTRITTLADRNVAVPGPHGVRVRLRVGHPVPRHLLGAYEQAVAGEQATGEPVSPPAEPSGKAPAPTELQDLTVAELRERAKAQGITAVSRLRKDQLIDALT